MAESDILIIGAGPAGQALAVALADAGFSVCMVEASPAGQLAQPAYDGREIALTHLSADILKRLGIWQLFPAMAVGRIRRARVFNGRSRYSMDLDASRTGRECLGFMLSNQHIRRACFQRVSNSSGIELITGIRVERVEATARGGAVFLESGRVLRARLVVAADSRFSTARRQMGISTRMVDFGRTCIVCTMRVEGDHRQEAWECFHEDRTLAVLPLERGRVSIVITLPAEQAGSVMAMAPEALAEDVARRIRYALGNLLLEGERHAYPLVATLADRFYKPGFVLVGAAAVGMHPVTAHGYNLGLQGAWNLACQLSAEKAKAGDWSAEAVLRRWSRQHMQYAAPIWYGTNLVVGLFNDNRPLARLLRAGALRLGNHCPPLQGFILDRLMELPSGHGLALRP